MPRKGIPKQLFQRIYDAIEPPTSLPLEISRHEYKETKASEVERLINNGYSPEKAFHTVTGESFNVKKNIPAIVGAVAFTTALAVGAGFGALNMGKPDAASKIVSSEETMEGITAATDAKTIVVAGMDTRPEEDRGYGTIEDMPGNRTDAIAVVKIAPVSNQVVSIVSIPRDTAVTTEVCEGGDYNTVKINSIYDAHGLDCLQDVAGDITGQTVDGAATFNFDAFSTVIDSIGGIDITVDGPVVDDTLGEIIPKAGTHHLDGQKSLDYARARKVEGTNKSDLDRVEKQQQVALAVMAKLKSTSKTTQVKTVKDIITKVLPDMDIDGLSPTELLPLIKLSSQLSPEDVALGTIEIIGEDGEGNLIYDEELARQMFNEMKYSATSPSESTSEITTQGTQETHG